MSPNFLKNDKRAQGGIEYLLIIGAAVLVVAVVAIAMSGVLNSSDETTKSTLNDYDEAQKVLKYPSLGYLVEAEMGKATEFDLDINPKNPLLRSIFPRSDYDFKIILNETTWFDNGWIYGSENITVKAGDTLRLDLINAANNFKTKITGTFEKTDASCWNLEADPVPICSIFDLEKIREYPNKAFELQNDIDASSTAELNGGAGFEPVGSGCTSPNCGDAITCERELGCGTEWHTEPYCYEASYSNGEYICNWSSEICQNECGGGWVPYGCSQDRYICDDSEDTCNYYCYGWWDYENNTCQHDYYGISYCGNNPTTCVEYCRYTWNDDVDYCENITSEMFCGTNENTCGICSNEWREAQPCENTMCTTKETCEREYGCKANWFGEFTGTLDGGNHKITNLKISQSTDRIGLFRATTGATIKNISLENINYTGGTYTGGIVGYANSTTLENVSVQGNITAGHQTGGIAGYLASGTITNGEFEGTINSSSSYVGGIIGNDSSSTLTNVSASGIVKASSERVGGIVGNKDGGTINGATFTGDVNSLSSSNAGGIVGSSSNITISNATVTGGNIKANGQAGGIIGASSSTNVNSANVQGNITVTSSFSGGIIGNQSGGTINGATYSGNIATASSFSGGITGRTYSNGTITKAFSSGSNTATGDYAGGITGYLQGTLTKSGSSMNTKGRSYVGGAIGYGYYISTINNIYARGDVTSTITANNYTGGLIGRMQGASATNKVQLDNSYSTGKINGTGTLIYGFVGNRANATNTPVTTCFWDTTTSTKTTGADITTGILGYPTATMKIQGTYTGWDFTNIWKMDTTNDGYPSLR